MVLRLGSQAETGSALSTLYAARFASKMKASITYNISKDLRVSIMQEITARELDELMRSGADVQLIDVRQPAEHNFARIHGAKLIPLGDIVKRMDEIDPARETVIHCKMGQRSARAIEILMQAGFKGNLRNLRGGITAWSNEVDPKVPKY